MQYSYNSQDDNFFPEDEFQPMAALVPTSSETENAKALLNTGKTLYKSYLARSRKGDLDAAIHHFQKAVELEPNLAEAYVQLASALWDKGTINLELAQFYCETALKLDPEQSDAHLFLGYFLQRAGFLDDAVVEYQKAIAKAPWISARPRVALGNALLKQSLEISHAGLQIQTALRGTWQFMVGMTLLPLDKQTFSLLQEALFADAQVCTLHAVASGCRKIGFHAGSRFIYKIGLNLMPKEGLFYHLLGDDYFYDAKNYPQAIAAYEKALTFEPNDLGLLKKLARAYSEINAIDNATELLCQVAILQPDDFETLYQLGQLFTEQQAYMKALYYLKEATRVQPNHPYTHSNMGYILFKMSDTEGAYEEYKQALDLGTDPIWLSTVAQTVGTMTYQVYGKPKQALEYFEHAVQCNPQNIDALAMLADVYFELGQLENALEAYKNIMEIDPSNGDCLSNIGYILWQLDYNDAAIDAYVTSIHFNPNNPVAFNNMGVIYLDDKEDPAKALHLFEEALALKPTYTLACFNLGRAHQQLGHTIEAADYYSRAKELNIDTPELDSREIDDYLDQLFD